MAKKSMILKQQAEPKFSSRRYNRCKLCGRPHATVLDFAYTIHSAVGNRCVGGRIDGRNVPIRQELESGQTVEILTASNQTPKAEWVNIAQSSHAKSKIRAAVRELSAAKTDTPSMRRASTWKWKSKRLVPATQPSCGDSCFVPTMVGHEMFMLVMTAQRRGASSSCSAATDVVA